MLHHHDPDDDAEALCGLTFVSVARLFVDWLIGRSRPILAGDPARSVNLVPINSTPQLGLDPLVIGRREPATPDLKLILMGHRCDLLHAAIAVNRIKHAESP